MTYLGLFFFLIRLGLANCFSFFHMGLDIWRVLPFPVVVLLVGLFFLACVAIFFLINTSLSQRTTSPNRNLPLITRFANTQQLNKEILFWEKVLEQQPTHRDVLWNLSQLYGALGDEQKSQEYLQRAKEVDPNSPLFATPNPTP